MLFLTIQFANLHIPPRRKSPARGPPHDPKKAVAISVTGPGMAADMKAKAALRVPTKTTGQHKTLHYHWLGHDDQRISIGLS